MRPLSDHSLARRNAALAIAVLAFSTTAAFTAPSEDALRLRDDLFVLRGAVNTGVLVHGDAAILFDCDDSVAAERLTGLGVKTVEAIRFTQFRRPNTAGDMPFPRAVFTAPPRSGTVSRRRPRTGPTGRTAGISIAAVRGRRCPQRPCRLPGW